MDDEQTPRLSFNADNLDRHRLRIGTEKEETRARVLPPR
jgi:hypothetical protein